MLAENTVLDGVYQIVREIGRGGAGIVYLAYHLRLQKYVVLKNARMNRTDLAYLRNEADMLKGLHHPSLPQVYDFLQIGDDIYTVIDYIDGWDFDKLIAEGYLTETSRTGGKASLQYFTTTARQEIIFGEMKRIVREYLELWYI